MAKPILTLEHLIEKVNDLQYFTGKLVAKLQNTVDSISKQEQLYKQARLAIGRDASPLDIVNDELGCAESVSVLLSKVIKFPIITGTWTLNNRFSTDLKFTSATAESGRGTLIIAATGTGNGKIRGHVGILGNNKNIMSARSADGIWEINYTHKTWLKRWRDLGEFEVHYYKLV